MKKIASDGTNTYIYDSANRLISINSNTTYTYNGLGDRLSQTVDSVTTNYTLDLNSGLTQVLNDGENIYTYGLGRISQTHVTTEYFLGDALGSVRQLTDSTGEITLAKSYDPYGTVTQSAGNGQSMYAYTGEQMDISGLTYLRARYYNPTDGRFISRDTWSGDVNNPHSLNRWMYVEGNPTNRTDPSGHWYCTGMINCEDWVEKSLGNLRRLDPQIVSDFERYDTRLTMIHRTFTELTAGRDPVDSSRDIYLCDLSNIGFEFKFLKMSTFGAVARPTYIGIDTGFNDPNKPTTVALVGHEFYHLLRQSFFVATTIYGELLAAQYEAYLVQLQGASLPSHLRPPGYDPINGVRDMNPNYGPDLVAYRNFTPYPWFEPLYPLGVTVTWPAPTLPECVTVSPGQPMACQVPIAPSPPAEPISTHQP